MPDIDGVAGFVMDGNSGAVIKVLLRLRDF